MTEVNSYFSADRLSRLDIASSDYNVDFAEAGDPIRIVISHTAQISSTSPPTVVGFVTGRLEGPSDEPRPGPAASDHRRARRMCSMSRRCGLLMIRPWAAKHSPSAVGARRGAAGSPRRTRGTVPEQMEAGTRRIPSRSPRSRSRSILPRTKGFSGPLSAPAPGGPPPGVGRPDSDAWPGGRSGLSNRTAKLTLCEAFPSPVFPAAGLTAQRSAANNPGHVRHCRIISVDSVERLTSGAFDRPGGNGGGGRRGRRPQRSERRPLDDPWFKRRHLRR